MNDIPDIRRHDDATAQRRRELVLRRRGRRALAVSRSSTRTTRSLVRLRRAGADRGRRRGLRDRAQPARRPSRVAPPRRSDSCSSRPATSPTTSLAHVGSGTGYPWADLLYLPAYPFIAVRPAAPRAQALPARHHRRQRDRRARGVGGDLAVGRHTGPHHLRGRDVRARSFAAAYPILDVILLVAIAHAVFTLPRWVPAAWLLFGGLTVMLIADTVVRAG